VSRPSDPASLDNVGGQEAMIVETAIELGQPKR
jgi:hypothetical protein